MASGYVLLLLRVNDVPIIISGMGKVSDERKLGKGKKEKSLCCWVVSSTPQNIQKLCKSTELQLSSVHSFQRTESSIFSIRNDKMTCSLKELVKHRFNPNIYFQETVGKLLTLETAKKNSFS